ncbi:hypothetical protein [Paenibacillus sp. KS-LC4]|uniref:hypothetical protein n=1 Tax=Paenibacillus sp. KS-LC4 TaxID=2979727 RepID=UPI0030D06BA9
MSVKSKFQVKNIKSASRKSKRARTSSCSCQRQESANDNRSNGCRRTDPAVEGVQDAGKELSKIFKRLENEEVAEKLVKAIRCHDARAVQNIIGCDCKVVQFFCTQRSDCVRVCCLFGRDNEVTISFDICIKRENIHRY